ncbi:MAG: PLP-dependent aminotransferase family protein [Bacteroidales bacterium]|nr:PLP-dependent aminotransferase family protein [Bacteroidales bacterium]
MNLYDKFATIIKTQKRSIIRELLKLTQNKEVISFAGGLPSPESFPIDELKEIVNEVLETDGAMALQYGETEGDKRLKNALINKYKKEGINLSQHNIIITTASQQALDLVSKVFIDKEDNVICELPSFLGGLSAFRSYGAQLIGVPIDNEGIIIEVLEKKLLECLEKNKLPKFIYVIPDFQNPSGISMSYQRRVDLLNIAYKYDVLIVEDAPYRELRYDGIEKPMLYALDTKGYVITLGTMSKTFAPGLRLGWILANPEIIDKIVTAKQATDLCTSSFVQKIAALYLEKNYYEKNIEKIKKLYAEKRNAMLSALEKYMPDCVKWTCPEGGLFMFLILPEYMDSQILFEKAINNNVAFVPGSAFYCDGTGANTMRLNFSFMSIEKNVEGVKRLAEVIKCELKK